MITTVEAIKGLVTQHELKYLVVMNMDRQKQSQGEGSVAKCLEALETAVRLLRDEPFRVEAWKGTADGNDETPRNKGGKRPKLAYHFEWIVQPDRGHSPVVNYAPPSGANAELMAAINGIGERLDALEDDAGDEPAEVPEPKWLAPALERAFAIADKLLGLGQGAPSAAINGPSIGGPVAGVNDEELLRAVLRANKDPKNAQFAAAIIAQYGDAAAAQNPAKDEASE